MIVRQIGHRINPIDCVIVLIMNFSCKDYHYLICETPNNINFVNDQWDKKLAVALIPFNINSGYETRELHRTFLVELLERQVYEPSTFPPNRHGTRAELVTAYE